MQKLNQLLGSLPLGQQLAVAASGLCLVATLSLVLLATYSSDHTRASLEDEYGNAVASQLASRLASDLATGDRLGATSELARLAEQPSIAAARVLDVEGRELAAVGRERARYASYRAPILIAGDAAGQAIVWTDTSAQDDAQRRFILALSGLAVLLSVVVYALTRAMARGLTQNIQDVSQELLPVTGPLSGSGNEVSALRDQVAALPLDLLKPTLAVESDGRHWVDTAILYIYLKSLPGYVDTIDERRLQRYVAYVHRIIYGASGYYGGNIVVTRQFGLAVYFNGDQPVGSPALRAASCAWLIRESLPRLKQTLRLSVNLGLAIGASELGPGSDKDIYPGLYTQAALDELHDMGRVAEDSILLTSQLGDDVDLQHKMALAPYELGWMEIEGANDQHRDLLERQLQLLLRALDSAGGDEFENGE